MISWRIAGTEEIPDQGLNPPKHPRETPFWQNLQANTMRRVESTQVELGGAFISDIVIEVK